MLQFAHLHLGLQSGRAFDGRHQEERARLPSRPLHAEVAPPSPPGQTEAQRVPQHPGCGDPEEHTRGGQVGHHRQEVEGDGARGLRAHLVFKHTGVPLTAHWGRLDVGGAFHVGTLHLHTLKPPVGVHTDLIRGAVVHPVLTLINVCAAAVVSGEVVSGGTVAVEAAGSVDALMDTEAAGLPQREQEALVDVCADVIVPA